MNISKSYWASFKGTSEKFQIIFFMTPSQFYLYFAILGYLLSFLPIKKNSGWRILKAKDGQKNFCFLFFQHKMIDV